MKNLFFFNQRSNAAAQATECAYTTGQKFGVNPTKTSTFGRLATYIGLVFVMLITLGVGQMKGFEVYLYTEWFQNWQNDGATFKIGTDASDANGTSMTQVGSTRWFKCTAPGTGTYYIKRLNSAGDSKWNSFSVSLSSSNNVFRVTDWNAGQAFSMYITGSNIVGSWDTNDADGKMTISSGTTFSKTFSDLSTSTNYSFKVVEMGTWDRAAGHSAVNSNTNCTEANDDGNAKFTPYIGTGTTTITYDISTGKITITCPKIPITLDKNGGTSAGSATVDVGASALSTITHAAKTDWNLTGYWTNTSGGYKVINADGTFVTYNSNVSTYLNNATPSTWKKTSATTLYAQWNQSFPVTYNANGGSGTMTDASSPYSTGATVTVKTNTFTRDGYTFTGWNTSAEGDGTPYANGATFTISAATTLYAQWSENKSTVSLVASPTGAGTFTSGSAVTSVLAGVATKPAVTAVPVPGYKFTSWAVSGGATISSTSTNPTTVTGKGAGADATLTATFVRKYAFIEGRFTVANSARNSDSHTGSSAADWSESSTNIAMDYDATNHRFYRHTYKTPAQLKAQQSGYDQWFSFKTSTTDGALSGTITTYHPSSNTDLTTAGYSNKKSTQTSTTSSNYKFNNSGTTGYVILYFDESNVWYELEHTLTYNGNGNTSGSVPAAETYYDNGATVTTLGNVAGTPLAKTGYNFSKWNTKANGSGTNRTAESTWPISENTTLYAQWTAKTYTITLDKQTSATGYGTSGTAANPTATYDAALPAISGTMPSGTGTYGFMGFYTGENGTGSRLTDASGVWIASVDGYTDADKKWIHPDDVTLYAYYKTAEIAALTFVNAVVSPSATVQVTPTIEPTPAATTHIDWRVLYSNGTALPSQPSMSAYSTNGVQFTAPSSSATYLVEAVLRTGSTPNAGTTIHTKTETFQVAGDHTVTILYQDGDGRTLAASTEIEARPLAWTTLGDITPPDITGYTFARWDAGDGVSIKNGESDPVSTTTTASIQIKATYDGTLTAVYTKKRLIYFYNTLNWESVFVYFYKNNSYWESTGEKRGSGADPTYEWTNTPYSEELHGEMHPIEEGSKIYYFDAEAEGVPSSYATVTFTEDDQDGYGYFWGTKAIKRDDYASTSLPMFVPLADQTPVTYNSTKYYFNGYWMNYPENSGYTLKIYDSDGASTPTRTIRFPYSEDLKMPLKLEVDLNDASRDYYFTIYREDGTVLSADYGMNQNWHSDVQLNDASKKIKITTTASGIYTFTLVYKDKTGTKDYYITVDYPIGTNDYRVWYSDNAAWSGDAHKSGWYHASDVIRKNADAGVTKYDTVSFYIAKGATISMKFQYASAIAEAGTVTWSNVAGGTISLGSYSSIITEAGVYNFIIKQVGTANPVVEKVEPYTGNFYIRTDCAGDTKWDSYKASDHLMTYSDYAEEYSGYSHYFVHWVTNGSNVKFCIANDFSASITDTLVQDYGTAIANINSGGYLASGDAHNANIRFMYDEAANKLSRAYIAGSGNITDRFLVLEGDSKMFDENGHALTGDYQDHDKWGTKLGTDNQVIMHDDENFVYERTIQVQPTATGKLTAKYNNNVQYFIGSSSETVELLGGSSSTKYTMRIIYDFKTNRLVTAYIPSGTITEPLAIHADIMLVREHQEAGQQLTFSGEGSALSDVKTVYGVMRFNRWTLNNKQTTGEHSVVGDPKSIYERALYWISFPFDVNLSDVFGFGTYGTDWIIQEYDGAERAAKGYWADSEGFWKYITNRRGVVLEAGKGYVLALDLDRMKDNNTSFWANNIEQVELFFPSAEEVKNIEATDTEITVDSHACTITPRPGQTDDRTKKDSHWNIIGVPSYANYGSTLKDGSGNTVTWNDNPETKDLPFLYEWNTVDNTYSVQSGTTYPFKAMHAYMVQYSGKLKWTLASATPVSAPARVPSAAQNIEFRMELQHNSQAVDQTFLRMTNDEEISANFDFNYDLSKQMNSGKANIYTMVEGYIQTAGNCLPMSEQTTVVPVGVKIATDGDYTFAIPEGTEGVGVTLIDKETGIRTSLSALAYTVSLEAGTYNERFVLEISPIQHIATELETSDIEDQKSDVRKLLIDGLLYIVRDGKVYDARGARIE